MIRQLFLFALVLAVASAFAPAPVAFTAKSTALNAVKLPKVAPALAGVSAAVVPQLAMATEGTNEWLGVDDLRLLAVLFLGHWAILTLYLNWSKGFDEEEDFFGEIDYTGRK
uniref:PSII 6.1 kDa protein n=1 Tax=Triparma pacifica TaxID=91992 RepID=A0A7S2QVY5_9STRA|mmetsp:Transcript_97/g.135  ORF Transcript_97/g.135 Transcript_97/m.135 type:complete len:112 (+) Transcript_97:32-367(+)|eukprot:CAMPEP_0118645032 /NCGR_PEP_ID=MMETSP0785-20121206/7277_1 /TAXON_ID=91992 /ORGANISM="Bolidomonas pacifica, Strain CCMP 1866" /LENGTH=111 /DNA_ID=CAMNT_0006536873 /DNA_START=44 /DNA_END=379 /DNA_ORIENTATION=+